MNAAPLPADTDFARLVDGYRRELLAHCYRMLGSYHDAEDAVQETYLRAWRAFDRFEGRSSVRTWIYRIATRVCLTAAESRTRRVLPSGLGGPAAAGAAPGERRTELAWLEPLPDRLLADADPAAIVARRESTRLAFVAALQELPARQRASLLLREVVGLSAAEVAELLDLSTAAVNSALQRARAHVGRGPGEHEVAIRADVDEQLLDRFIVAFEADDMAGLADLLRHDVELEMPPIATWFAGRDPVLRFFHSRVRSLGRRRLVPTHANGCPAAASYLGEDDGSFVAHSILVFETNDGTIGHIYAFLDPDLFAAFDLPMTWV